VAIRATISLVQLQASTSLVTLEAQTQYENSNATEIWIDPDSNNRFVKDEIPLSEVLINVFSKVLEDTTVIDEQYASHYSKNNAPDLFNITDTFVKVVSYKRDFTDAFTLDDASQIDKDFYGNKGNIFAFLDIIGLEHTKLIEDSYSFSDVIAIALLYEREFNDPANVNDTYVSSFTKLVEDSITLDDTAQVDKDYYSYTGNNFGFTDILGNDLSKGLSNLFTFTEEHGLQLSKSFTGTDVVSMGDAVNINKVSGYALNGAAFNTAALN
jgi:transcription termination factor NusB